MVRLKEAVPSSLGIHIYTGGDSLVPVLGTCSRRHNRQRIRPFRIAIRVAGGAGSKWNLDSRVRIGPHVFAGLLFPVLGNIHSSPR
jgi:hypothetical protein